MEMEHRRRSGLWVKPRKESAAKWKNRSLSTRGRQFEKDGHNELCYNVDVAEAQQGPGGFESVP